MKKVFSIILCLTMIFSFMAMAFADDADGIKISSLSTEAVSLIRPGYTKLAEFSDVDASKWYAEGFAWCLEKGILQGKSDTKMAPFDKISRGEIVTMLWRVEGKPVVNFAMQYSDVNEEAYYGEAIRWATAEKVVDGYGNGTFKPSQTIKREELAQILYNYVKLKDEGFTGSWMFLLDYQDAAEVASWANEAMHWCVMKGIITGSNGKLLPKGLASRAEAATMFMRLNPEVVIQEEPETPIVGGWSKYTENQELDMAKIPEGAKEAFEKATGDIDGASYKAIAYLGSQVVAGTNYKFLCEVAPVVPNAVAAVKEVVIFKALDGSAKIASAEEISADLIGNDGKIEFSGAGLAGGYYYGDAAGAVDSAIAEAFENATKGLLGVHYEPLAIIGQQVVAGTNYAVVVKATTVSAEPASAVGVVTLYVGVDGTNTITVNGNLK